MLHRPLPNDLTSGSLWINIWQLSWPMLLIMLFNFFVGFADVYVAGRISPEAQAAVGFVAQLYFLFIIMANAVGVGTVALVSRSVGAGDTRKALAHAKQALIFGVILAAAWTVVGLSLYRPIVDAAGFPPQIRATGQAFLRIFSLALGPNYLLIVSNAVFRATGQVKKPLITMFLVSVVNAFADFGLVFGLFFLPELGVEGIAWATAGSTTLGMAVNAVLFAFGDWRPIYERPWTLYRSVIQTIVRVAWPAATLQIAWNAGAIVLYNILGRLGEASVGAIAAITNGLRIEAVIFLPAFALNMSASVLVGQNLGAGKPDRAARVGWEIALAGMLILSLTALCVYIYAEELASVLTRDSAVARETARYLRVNMFSEPFMAVSLALSGGLQGAGDSKGTMWVIVTGMWLIRIPLAYLLGLSLGFGAMGVWIAMVTSMVIQGLLMAHRFHSGRWKEVHLT